MEHKEFNIVSKDGTYLAGRFWKPSGFPRGSVCLVHGIGEHSGRYDAWARKFCQEGLMVYAVDLRGHGLSEGKRGHVNHLSEYFDDIGSMVRRCKRNWGDLPQFLYGHSMGGALVLGFLLKRRQDFSGAIVTSPWLRLVEPPGPFMQKIAASLDKIFPELTFSTGIKSNQLTQQEAGQVESDNDKLMHSRISLRTFNQLNAVTTHILERPTGFHLPLFFSHGTADTLTSFEVTKEFAERVGPLAAFFAAAEARHEIHREPTANELFNHIMNWMKPKLKSSVNER